MGFFTSIWRIMFGVLLVIIIWLISKYVFPIGRAVVQIESTRNSLDRVFTGGRLDVRGPVNIGRIVHINFVDMPEPGFVVVYRPAGNTDKGFQPIKFFGASELLAQGIKKDFDIALVDQLKCTYLSIGLFKDLDKDGKYNFDVDGKGLKTNWPGEGMIHDSNLNNPLKDQISQSVDVSCR